MHTTERHRNKRPFQPAITTYFARDDFDSDDDEPRGLGPSSRLRTQHHHHHHHSRAPQQQRESLAPQVPGHVQSDLLQVGMRIRKSVPEGYKTHSTKMTTLPSIQTTLSTPPTNAITAVGLDVRAPRDAAPDDPIHQRELLPFCGLHKIGGYAEQPTTNMHLYAGIDSTTGQRPTNMFPLPAEAFSQPFSSQGSTDSGYGSDVLRSNPSKRSWRDEDDGTSNMSGSNFFFAMPSKGIEVDEVPVSPLSENPDRGFNALPPARQFAQPKSRRPVISRNSSGIEDVDMDLENEARLAVGSASDFEEADFLAGGEVHMGGV